MKSLDLLSQVIQDLKQHENSLQLKKLLFYVCQQVWENDQTKIDSADWQDLIPNLISNKPSFVSLSNYIYGMAKTTNKPKKYLLVANTLVNYLEKVYFVEEDITQAFLASFQEEVTLQEISNHEKNIEVYDPYKVRLEIIGNTNPLKAKILLFSALNERFNFSSQDWASLKSQQLDELLQNLLDSCPTFNELVGKLEVTAGILQEVDEFLQAARVISQSLKPFYTAMPT